MKLLKDKEFKGLFFEIINDGFVDESGRFEVNLRIINLNESRKKVKIDVQYISVEHGLLDAYLITPHGFHYDGRNLQPNSFVDIQISFEGMKQSREGDRIELDINEGKIASLLLKKERNQWWILDEKDKKSKNKELRNRIEHFEYIDEKFGLTLQKFSARIVDENSIKLFCEVVALNGEIPKEGFNIEVAIYDRDDNIVDHHSIERYDGDFKGFEVFNFGTIRLDIPVEEIGKIRIYPTR